MWTYFQKTGELFDPTGQPAGVGYSGLEDEGGKNDPSKQNERDIGPIPEGEWQMGHAMPNMVLGPVCMRLFPMPGTETFGRSGFWIHGDSSKHPGDASHGCIVIGPATRDLLAASSDRMLLVKAAPEVVTPVLEVVPPVETGWKPKKRSL